MLSGKNLRGPYKKYILNPEEQIPRRTNDRLKTSSDADWDQGAEHPVIDETEDLDKIACADLTMEFQVDELCNTDKHDSSVGFQDNNASQVAQVDPDQVDMENPFGSIDNPLYEDAKCSLTAAMYLILQFALQFNLSKKCVNALLSLIQNLIPCPNNLPTTKYQFVKSLSKLANCGQKKYFYCTNKKCQHTYPEDEIENACPECHEPVSYKKNFFVQFNLNSILKD